MLNLIHIFLARKFPKDTPHGRVSRGVFWMGISTGLTYLLGIVSAVLVARILSVTEFGHLSMLRSSIDMLTLFAGMALGSTANRYVAVYRTTQPDRAGHVIGMTKTLAWFSATFAALMLIVFAENLAETLNAKSLVYEIRLCSLVLFFSTISGVYSGILGSLESFKMQSKVSIMIAVISLPLMVGGVYVAGVDGGLLVLGIISGLSVFFSVKLLRQKMKAMGLTSRLCWNSEQRKIFLEFTIPSLIGSLLVIPIIWLGNVILVGGENGYHEMGIFSVCNTWRLAVMAVPNIIGIVTVPILSNLHGVKDYESYKGILKSNLITVTIITLFPTIILGFLSSFILGLYGASYQVGKLAMVLMLAAGLLCSIANFLGQILTSIGKMWIGFWLNLCWASIFLISAWYLCPLYGATGLAGAYAISYLFHIVTSALVSLKLISLRF